jgi:predicted enzyme related to lactoylglutathione lyase
MSANPIVWWELATHDQEKSVKFFEKFFGWEFRMDEEMGFHKQINGKFTLDGGAIFTLRRAKLPFIALYIKVDDIHEIVKLIQENGGFIVDPPAELAPNEWICLFNEPSGVTFAMIQEPQKRSSITLLSFP